MGGITNHQGAFGGNAQLSHQLMKHARVGFASGFVSGTRSVKNAAQSHLVQGLVQALAAFACGHRQQMLALMQRFKQRQDTLKQGQIVVVQSVVVAVALAQQRVFVFGYIRCGMRQGRHQGHANHISGLRMGRCLPTHIGDCGLYAAHDDLGGVVQSTVPIESNQVKLAQAVEVGHGQQTVVIREANRLARSAVCPSWDG